jgi:hypothetical protein
MQAGETHRATRVQPTPGRTEEISASSGRLAACLSFARVVAGSRLSDGALSLESAAVLLDGLTNSSLAFLVFCWCCRAVWADLGCNSWEAGPSA